MKNEEHRLQAQCVKYFRLRYPRLKMLLFAVPNGAFLNGTQLQRIKQWNKLQAEGVVKGVSDLLLLVSRGKTNGLCIEMKTTAKHSKQSKEQKAFQDAVTVQNYHYLIIRSFDEFKTIIDSYIEKGEIKTSK